MKGLKNTFLGMAGLAVIAFLLFKISKRAITDQLLKKNAIYTKGVIIDDKNFAPNSPVKHTYSYSYEFIVGGRSYVNNAHDPNLRIGDTVEVEYVKGWPSLNRAAHPAE
jgi:hypothetical protein